MLHYICNGGCKGVSDVPGTCQAQECSNHGKQLEECNCTDGKHGWEPETQTGSPEEQTNTEE